MRAGRVVGVAFSGLRARGSRRHRIGTRRSITHGSILIAVSRDVLYPFVALTAVLWLVATPPAGARQGSGTPLASAPAPPSTGALLDRAAAYLGALLPRLTNVVAEEQYVQKIVSPSKTRTLTSDYLIVRLQETGSVAGFRDVFQVDGKAVRDRDERLLKLFVTSPGSALRQASAIAEESARYNISNVGTIGNPFLVMAFVQADYRTRFRFQSPRLDKSLGADVYAVQYEEFVSPSILKGNGNRDVFSRGRLWIEGGSGRILRTELRLGAQSARAGIDPIEIDVRFRWDEQLDLLVPTEMREFYPDIRLGDVRSVATYGRFRRFGVTTSEVVEK